MSNFTESELVPAAIKIILKETNGIETKDLIIELRNLMVPSGEDLEILPNRSDDKFSQKVRNLKSHKTLENKGYSKFYANKFFITEKGKKFLNEIPKLNTNNNSRNIEKKSYFNRKDLSFEDLMNIFLKSQKNKDHQEILNINKEFERRVSKRKLLGKKPMRTSVSGLEQTQKWLENNSELKTKNNEENKIIQNKENYLLKDLNKEINKEELSQRLINSLTLHDVYTINDLIQYTDKQLMSFQNFGKTLLDEVKNFLSYYNLRLGNKLIYENSLKKEEIIIDNKLKSYVPISKLKINILKEWFLSVRTVNCLKALGIEFVGDLIQWTELDLLNSRNFGRKSLIELQKYLKKNSLYLDSYNLIDINIWDHERFLLKNDINKNEFSKKIVELSVSSSLFVDFEEFKKEQSSFSKIIIEKQLRKEELEKIIIKDLEKIIELFKERPKEIFLSRYGYLQKYETLEELGKKFKITRERVRQVESRINDSIGSIGAVDRSSLLRYFSQYEFVSFHKLFPKLDEFFLKVSNNSNKDISGDRLTTFIENYCGVKSNFFKTPERELVNFNKELLLKIFEVTPSGLTRENFQEIIKDSFGYNNFVCQSAFTFMEKNNLIKIINNKIYPLKLTRSAEVANILLDYPNGLHWKKIIKIGNSSYTKNKWSEDRLMSDHSLDMAVNRNIYLSDRGTHKSLKFCIEINRYEEILDKFISELKKLNKVTEFMEKVYKLVIQDEQFTKLNFYDARAVIKIYGQEKGIFHTGRSGTNTIGLIKNISPINLKQKIKNIIYEKGEEIHYQEILSTLIKTNEDVPINQALDKLVDDLTIFRIDMGTYLKYEDAINLCNIVEIKDYLEELLSNYEFITSGFIREKINDDLGYALSTYYYASLVKIIAKDNGWFCSSNYLSKKQKRTMTTDEYIRSNYEGNLSINENFTIFSKKIGVSKTYFYNTVSVNKLNFNTDWIHADD